MIEMRSMDDAPRDRAVLLRAIARGAAAACFVVGWYCHDREEWIEATFGTNEPVGVTALGWAELPVVGGAI